MAFAVPFGGTHLVPHSVNTVMQPVLPLALYAAKLGRVPVAKAVSVQVVDVSHVDDILKHAPVTALKLNLTIHCRRVAGEGSRGSVVLGTLGTQDASLMALSSRHQALHNYYSAMSNHCRTNNAAVIFATQFEVT